MFYPYVLHTMHPLLARSRGTQPALEFLDSAYMLWDNTVNKAYRVKGEIQPLQNAAADGVRKDIANFGEEVRTASRGRGLGLLT